MSDDSKFTRMPDGLDESGQLAYNSIMEVLRTEGATWTGGCTAFRSPSEWKERGEKYGTESALIVVYDGGSHRPYFTLDEECYDLVEKMQQALRKHGMRFEEATTWYGAVYVDQPWPLPGSRAHRDS